QMNKLQYLDMKKKFEHKCYLARLSYYESKFNSCSSNARHLWNEVNSCIDARKRTNSTMIEKLIVSGMSYSSDRIAPVLNHHFASVGLNLSKDFKSTAIRDIEQYLTQTECMFSFVPTSSFEVIQTTKSMKHNMSSNLFSCPSSLLVQSIGFLASPLAHIFNLLVTSGIFPDALKRAIIT